MIDRFSGYYKGRMTYSEMINMPYGEFHYFYTKLYNRMTTKEGAEEAALNEVKEKIEEEVGM